MEVKDPGTLRRCRKSKGYTQRELAFLVRRSHTTIYALEAGKLKNITEDLACAIAARLDRDWEDLFVAHEVVAIPGAATASQSDTRVAS
ncbi:helix-turn-helix transcriptional regulator [Dietzia sp. CQ4]|nr:helix-turn-helix transcriptional regulator [Dietzia sp. CQ4]